MWGPRNLNVNRGSEVEHRLNSQRRFDLLDAFSDFNNLQCTCLRVRLDATSFGPLVRFIVVANIGEQQARAGLMNYDANVAADPNRPKIRILGLVNTMELEPRSARFGLKIKDGNFS